MTPAAGEDDLTRKQRRDLAREQRRAAEEAARAQAARRRRLIQLGGALGVAVVILVVAIVVSTSGGGSSHKGIVKGKAATTTVSEVRTLLSGVQQSGERLGVATAPVTLLYYGDLECPVCQDFTLSTLPSIINNDVRAGKVQIDFHSLETATQDPTIFEQQQAAALAAGKQNLLWSYIELFYHEQGTEDTGYVTPSYLQGLAQQVPGLNYKTWNTERFDPALTSQVTSENQTANTQGLSSTPSLVFTGPKGTKVLVGAEPYSTVEQTIAAVA